jgi:hypothetical protein
VLQKGLHIQLGVLDRYLDNLVAMPVILTLFQVEKIWLFRKGNDFKLPVAEIVLVTLYILLITEIVFPALSTDFTGDWADAIFYSTGSLGFYLYNQRNKLWVQESGV